MKHSCKIETPVQVLPCRLVISKSYPILAATPDTNVDKGCIDHFGLAEVKCQKTKFNVTPLDACSDPKFCMKKIYIIIMSDSTCKLKDNNAYYAQVQGQKGVIAARWCDFM